MRSLTPLHESRGHGPQNFRSPVQTDFCNKIGQERSSLPARFLLGSIATAGSDRAILLRHRRVSAPRISLRPVVARGVITCRDLTLLVGQSKCMVKTKLNRA
jgi:hypothetical protein